MRRMAVAIMGVIVVLPASAGAERHAPFEAVLSFALLWPSGRRPVTARTVETAKVPAVAKRDSVDKPGSAAGADVAHAHSVKMMKELWKQDGQLKIGACLITGSDKIDELFTGDKPPGCIPSRTYELVPNSFKSDEVTENYLCAHWMARIGDSIREHDALMIREKHGAGWEWSFLAIRIH